MPNNIQQKKDKINNASINNVVICIYNINDLDWIKMRYCTIQTR